MQTTDVYEESEADLVTERNIRSTKSRSPDVHYVKVTKGDRKISSGYFSTTLNARRRAPNCNAYHYFIFCFLFFLSIFSHRF